MHSNDSSSNATFSRILSGIRGARQRLQGNRPRPADGPSSSQPPLKTTLPAPEDITAHLADEVGLEFHLARKVSQAYVDKAVELQFHTKERYTGHFANVIKNVRASKHLPDPDGLQTRLHEFHQTSYKRDLNSLLKRTVDLARVWRTVPSASNSTEQPEASTSTPQEEVEQDADEDADEAEPETGKVDAEDAKALSEMSLRASVILTRMYEKGFTFPRRHEKIKLAEATGLTYRQISIWFSNRRERSQNTKRKAEAAAAASREYRSATRESTIDVPPRSHRRTTTTRPTTTSPVVTVREGSASNPITLEDEAPSPTRTEIEPLLEDDAFVTDDEDGCSSTPSAPPRTPGETRVPSLTASMVTLDGTVSSFSDFGCIDQAASLSWPYNDPAHYVNIQSSSKDAFDVPSFDFTTTDLIMPSDPMTTPYWDPNGLSATAISTAPITEAPAQPAPSAEFLAGFLAGSQWNNNTIMAAAGLSGTSMMPPPPPPIAQETYAMPVYPQAPPLPMVTEGYGQPGPGNALPPNKRARFQSPQPPSIQRHSRPIPSQRKIAVPRNSAANNPSSLPHKVPALAASGPIPIAPRPGPHGERMVRGMPKRPLGAMDQMYPTSHLPPHMHMPPPMSVPILQQ